MTKPINRRQFLTITAGVGAGIGLFGSSSLAKSSKRATLEQTVTEQSFNQASFNLGFGMQWKNFNHDGIIKQTELYNIPEELNTPELLSQAINLIEEATNFSFPAVTPQTLQETKNRVDSARKEYAQTKNSETKEQLRQSLRELDMQSRQWAPMTVDFTSLPKPEQEAAKKLIYQVGPLVEKVYFAQRDPKNLQYKSDIIKTGNLKDYLHFWYSGGPWSLTVKDPLCSSHREFPSRVPNAGHWPENITDKDIEKIAPDSPLLSHFVDRYYNEKGEMCSKSINDNELYKHDLQKISSLLEEIATIPGLNHSLKDSLQVRANELKDTVNTAPFYSGDVHWIQSESPLDVLVGFYEEYHSPFNKTAIMEQILGVKDVRYEKLTNEFRNMIPAAEETLAQLLGSDYSKRDFQFLPAFICINSVGFADNRCEYVGIAINLPNVSSYGRGDLTKKVIMLNNVAAREQYVSRPMAESLMDPEQFRQLSSEGLLLATISHETVHGLGPTLGYDTPHGKMDNALGKYSSLLEEAKADLYGITLLRAAQQQGQISTQQLQEAVLSLFPHYSRGLSYGNDDVHGEGVMVEITALTKAGVLVETPEGRYKFDFTHPNFYSAFEKTGVEIMNIQKRGDYAAAEKLVLEAKQNLPSRMKEQMTVLAEQPRDFYPWYEFKFSGGMENGGK